MQAERDRLPFLSKLLDTYLERWFGSEPSFPGEMPEELRHALTAVEETTEQELGWRAAILLTEDNGRWTVDVNPRGVYEGRESARWVADTEALREVLVKADEHLTLLTGDRLEFEFLLAGREDAQLHQHKHWAETSFFLESSGRLLEVKELAHDIETNIRENLGETPVISVYERPGGALAVKVTLEEPEDLEGRLEARLRSYGEVLLAKHGDLDFDLSANGKEVSQALGHEQNFENHFGIIR